MKKLVDESGTISFGLYDEPISEVNYEDYLLETPMGVPVPRRLRSVLGKQFHFVGVMGPDLVVGLAVVDLKYLANGFGYVFDRRTRTMTETKKLASGGRAASIEPFPDGGRSVFSSAPLSIEIAAGRVTARGEGFEVALELDLGAAAPLRLCTRAGYRGWVYTQKTAPIRVSGSVSLHGERLEVASPEYMALSDWTSGFMRRETCWNWAAGAATLPDGRALGMNLSCGVNETSFTENAFWLGSSMTKVDTVSFDFERGDLTGPWRVASRDGKVDLTFRPEGRREERIAALVLSSRFSQLTGTFGGRLRRDDGEEIVLEGLPGFVEDHYAKW